MDKELFMTELEQYLNNRYGDGNKVTVKLMLKNNGVSRISVMFKQALEPCSPTIYIDELYRDYCNGESLANIADKILVLLDSACRHRNRYDLEMIRSWEIAKNHLDLRIMSKQLNAELLKGIVYYEHIDFAVYPVIVVDKTRDGTASIKITKELANEWGVSTDDILRAAMINTWSQNRYGCKRLIDAIKSIVGNDHSYSIVNNDAFENEMYLLSNTELHFGAAAILDTAFMKFVYEKIGGAFYVLPSSVHECIVLRKRNIDVNALKELVKHVNDSVVSKEEILSYNVYFFDGSKLSIADEGGDDLCIE